MEKRTGKELSDAELVKVLMPAFPIFNLPLVVTWCFSKDIAIMAGHPTKKMASSYLEP